jgi:hypothetical protein
MPAMLPAAADDAPIGIRKWCQRRVVLLPTASCNATSDDGDATSGVARRTLGDSALLQAKCHRRASVVVLLAKFKAVAAGVLQRGSHWLVSEALR